MDTMSKWYLIGVLIGFGLAALSGCSATYTLDTFYPRKYEPRTTMPWYGSAGGHSNVHGPSFKSMGGGS